MTSKLKGQVRYYFGYFKTIFNHEPGPCRIVPGIDEGSEDITVTRDGIAFISSGHRILGTEIPTEKREGGIYIFDYNYPEKSVQELPLLGGFDTTTFYPHGISLYEDPKSGDLTLYVVNHHTSEKDRIEIFAYDQEERVLNHLKSVTDDNIYNVNDLVVIAPETFYYTIDMHFTNAPVARHYELHTLVAWAKIAFYEKGESRILSSGYGFTNGINISPDGKYLYVAELVAGNVRIFERKEDNSIVEVKKLELNTGVDNIEVDRNTGELWLGCHPILEQFWKYVEDRSELTGAQVLKIRLDSKKAPLDTIDIREVFMNDGTLLKGGSGASYYDNKLLVGTVFDKLAYCEIKAF
ncbi:serum paraoxonase/arylesterase 1-like [Glandiceps talaboti]